MSYKFRQLQIVLLLMSSFIDCTNMTVRDALAKPSGNSMQEERKINPGDKVRISNQFDFGSISITGWERETAWAMVTSEKGGESASFSITTDPADARRILISTSPVSPLHRRRRVHLEVKIPRLATIEPIYVPRAKVEVADINGPVEIISESGTIIIRRVGSVKARTVSGEVHLANVSGSVTLQTSSANITATDIKGDFSADTGSSNIRLVNAGGLINVTTTTGNLDVDKADGSVRVVTINGRTDLRCVKGRVDVSDTNGVTTLVGVQGDVDIITSSGKASVTGLLRADGHYRLRTLSGTVQIILPDNSTDFTVTLSSYSGKIETDFLSEGASALPSNTTQRRLVQRFGDGRTRIELDSFDGRVRLGKIRLEAVQSCER